MRPKRAAISPAWPPSPASSPPAARTAQPLPHPARPPGDPMTKDDIRATIARIMEETFEIDPSRVTLDAKLYDDLEIDSIDAVDMIVQLKPIVGRRLEPDAFKSVRTVADVVDALYGMLNNPTPA